MRVPSSACAYVTRSFRLLASVFCLIVFSAAAPALAGTNFGPIAIGTSSSPVAVTLTFPSPAPDPTVGSIKVVAQGVTGLDFQQAAGGTCAVGATYAAGVSCTVNVMFTPKGVGLRMGAVLLYDNSSTPNLLATSFLSGVGNGGLLNFDSIQPIVLSGLGGGSATAVDAAGNLYVADVFNNKAFKVPVSGGEQAPIGSGLNHPYGVAVDGAGNVYIVDQGNNRVVEIPVGGGPETPVGSGLNTPFGVAVDGVGNVYIGDTDNARVVVVPAGGGPQTTLGTGWVTPQAVAVDAMGNVYIGDYGNNDVVKVPVGGGPQTTVGTGIVGPTGVAVDGAGNVYIAEGANGSQVANQLVLKVSATGTQTTIWNGNHPYAVSVDGAGNVYISLADYGDILQLLQLGNLVDLGNGTVGGAPGTVSLPLTNFGTAPLALTKAISPSQYSESDTCGSSVAVNSSCMVTLTFTPTIGIPLPGTTVPGTLTLTDNAPNSPQGISLTAQAVTLPTQLVVSTPPPGSIVQGGNAGTVTVKVEDSFGNLATTSSASVTLTVTGPSQYAQSYPVSAIGGISTFNLSSAVLSVPGNYIYTATSAGLSSTTVTEVVVPSAYNLPTQGVGMAGIATTVTLAFGTSGQLGGIKVVTQGTMGLDFQQATTNGGTCAVGTLYAPGQSCTVNVVFTPRGVGLRMGAVLLYDNATTPNLLATAFVTGAGQGGLLNFSTTQIPVPVGVCGCVSVAVDGAGNLYIADYGLQKVDVVPSNGGAQTTVGTGLTGPWGVAVDGAGNVYISEWTNTVSLVVKVPAGGGTQTTIGSGFNQPYGVAVDGAGNVYVADLLNKRVVKVPSDGGPQTTVGTGLEGPVAVAVDTSGNIYILDIALKSVVVVPAGGGPQTMVGSGLSEPFGVAVDAAGNIYVADNALNSVFEIPAGGGRQTTVGTGLNGPFGLAVDGAGNVYIADLGNSRTVAVERTQLPPTVSLGSVTVGATAGTASLSFTNLGNAPLSLSSIISPSQYSESDACQGSVPLNASCTLHLTFAPTTGSVSPGTTVPGVLTLTDNAPNSPQTIDLTAQAINNPPTCVAPAIVLSTTPFTVTATATCSDPQDESLVTTINCGDGTSALTGTTGTHTYSVPGTYTITTTATDTAGSSGMASVNVAVQAVSAVFPGGSSSNNLMTVPPLLPGSPPTLVSFSCTVSGIINGQMVSNAPAANYFITCSSQPPTVMLTSATSAQVNITIQTSGPYASTALRESSMARAMWYAVALPIPGFLLLGFGASSPYRRKQRSRQLICLGILSLLFLSVVSCGGHFTLPPSLESGPTAKLTPEGTYYVKVTDSLVPGSPSTGFVQTSLIVPLTVIATSN